MTMERSHENILYTGKGCGSAIAECVLALAGIPFRHIEVDYAEPGPGRDELLKLNPFGQIPTMVLADGKVLTETVAITMFAQAHKRDLPLVPPLESSDIPQFWRYLMLLSTSVYPTYTYGDDPKKWVAGEKAIGELKASTDRHREKLWLYIDRGFHGPYFLGENFSVLDIFITVMSHWRPGRRWFQDNCPRLASVSARVEAFPELKEILERNFAE